MTRVLRRMGIFPPEGAAEPTGEETPKRRSASKKGASRRPEGDRRRASQAKRLQLWFQDEARVGNKGRVCHRWWRRGERAPGTRQIGYQWAYIFTAVRPATGDDFTLVLPSVNAKVMDLFLAHFAETLDHDAHAVMMLDGAGWHDARALTVPDNVTLGAFAALQSRTQSRRAGLALSARTLPFTSRPRQHRRHHRRLLQSMDRPHRRNQNKCDLSAPIHRS